MANEWDKAYEEGRTPWDMDEPQPELVKFVKKMRRRGKALDLGAGTGSNSIFLAKQGFDVTGIDISNAAVKKAKVKMTAAGGVKRTGVREEGSWRVKFVQGSVLDLHFLGEKYDFAVDVGCFHSQAPEDRERFAESIASTMARGGTYFLMCFSDKEPNWGGPNRITQEELQSTFGKHFEIELIKDATYKSKDIARHFKGVGDDHKAYLCIMKKA